MSDVGQFVVFRLDDRRFALDLTAAARTERAVEVTPLPGAPDVVMGTINVHGAIVPVLNLRKRFGMRPREIDITDQFLLAYTPTRTFALVTDAVLEVIEQRLPTSGLNDDVSSDTSLAGGVVPLEDGILVITDLGTFLSADEEQALAESLSKVAE